MSLQPAEVVADGDGGEFLNLENLVAAQGPLLLIARIVEHKAPEQNPHGGTNWPTIADVLLCSGPMVGEAYLGQSFIRGAQTRTLRGVPAPKPGELAQPAKNGPGVELGIKAEYKSYRKPDGTQGQYLVFNPPTPAEYAAIQQVYAGGQGWLNAAAATARNTAAMQVTAVFPVMPAVPVQQFAPPAPAPVPAIDPAQAAAFAAWQAQQQAAATPMGAPTGAGPAAPAPWRAAG